MFYKLTLLKDLPGYPAGTQFSFRHGRYQYVTEHGLETNINAKMGLYGSNKMKSLFPIPEEIIDDPEWIKIEVDYSKIIDLACPECGETRADMSFSDASGIDGVRGIFVHLEYACGHQGGRFGRYFHVYHFAEDCGQDRPGIDAG